MDKYYVIQKADKTDTVSIDRLKPAYLECIPLSVVPPTFSAPSSLDPPVLVPSTQPPHSITLPTHPDSPTTAPRTSSRSASFTDFVSDFTQHIHPTANACGEGFIYHFGRHRSVACFGSSETSLEVEQNLIFFAYFDCLGRITRSYSLWISEKLAGQNADLCGYPSFLWYYKKQFVWIDWSPVEVIRHCDISETRLSPSGLVSGYVLQTSLLGGFLNWA
ncbi:hypothetical protein SprV_0200528300 [Sparganum proliferum]